MADPVGDDDTFSRGLEQARAALGRPVLPRPRPRSVPEPEPAAPEPPAPRARRPRPRAVVAAAPVIEDDDGVTPPTGDGRATRIAELEAENRRLRAALARIAEATRAALDD